LAFFLILKPQKIDIIYLIKYNLTKLYMGINGQ
jgi:hypothetical protein